MARGVPCGKGEVDFHRSGAKLKFLISYDLRMQPRRVFKKQVSYPNVIKSIDCPYIYHDLFASSCLSSQSRLPWFAFEVWTAIEQSLSSEWEYTVRSRDNGSGSELRQIRMIFSI